MYDFPELTFVTRHGCEPWDDLIVKLMLKWPGLHYSTSAFAPKYYPQSIIDYANTRGADKIIYAGYFPMGLSLERIMGDMQHVGFNDDVWPKFLRDNGPDPEDRLTPRSPTITPTRLRRAQIERPASAQYSSFSRRYRACRWGDEAVLLGSRPIADTSRRRVVPCSRRSAPGERRCRLVVGRHLDRLHDCLTSSPKSSLGTPTTATSATFGCMVRTFSASCGYTFTPPVMIMYALRSVR